MPARTFRRPDALHAVLFDPGRPVDDLPPRTAPAAVATRVCLGWNGTAESASAVLAALPWLQRADAVCILSADGYQAWRGPAAPELAAYLALHGVHADIVDVQVDQWSGRRRVAGGVHATSAAICWRWGRIRIRDCGAVDPGWGDAACAGEFIAAGDDEPVGLGGRAGAWLSWTTRQPARAASAGCSLTSRVRDQAAFATSTASISTMVAGFGLV